MTVTRHVAIFWDPTSFSHLQSSLCLPVYHFKICIEMFSDSCCIHCMLSNDNFADMRSVFWVEVFVCLHIETDVKTDPKQSDNIENGRTWIFFYYYYYYSFHYWWLVQCAIDRFDKGWVFNCNLTFFFFFFLRIPLYRDEFETGAAGSLCLFVTIVIVYLSVFMSVITF